MADIAQSLVDACGELGRDAALALDGVPEPGWLNIVVAPHEFFTLHAGDSRHLAAALPHFVTISTEQPGTPWFETSLRFARRAVARYDINRHGADAATARGVATRWLQLGATRSMIAPVAPTGRDVDVLFLGGDTQRRREVLAALAPTLQRFRCELRMFPIDRPVDETTPGLVFAADKYALLARSRVLLNVHRDERRPAYFEWARMVEAMANGCVVVTEPADGYAPLVAERDFLTGEGSDGLAAALTAVLDDQAVASPVGAAGQCAVVDAHPLRTSLAALLESVEAAIPPARSRPPLGARLRDRVVPCARSSAGSDPAPLPPFRPFRRERQALYDAFLAEVALRRRIDSLRCAIEFGTPTHVTLAASELHHARRATGTAVDVSVVLTLYDYEHYVGEALASVAAAGDDPAAGAVELVVVDDHSTDDGRGVVERFVANHPELDVLLVGRHDNQGLARARNAGVAHSHGRYVMMLDADNAVYPHALGRLRAALDADPTAAFAYGILGDFGARPGLRSHLPWNVDWLVAANYIDAQAMFHRSSFDRAGGYIDDDLTAYGWEDWELWLRLAAAGEHGVLVPEILGRYRTHPGSMVAITNLVGDALRAGMIARYPQLPWPELQPRR